MPRPPVRFDPTDDYLLATSMLANRRGDRNRSRQPSTVYKPVPGQAKRDTTECTICQGVFLLTTFRGKPVCQSCMMEAHEVVARTRDQVL